MYRRIHDNNDGVGNDVEGNNEDGYDNEYADDGDDDNDNNNIYKDYYMLISTTFIKLVRNKKNMTVI